MAPFYRYIPPGNCKTLVKTIDIIATKFGTRTHYIAYNDRIMLVVKLCIINPVLLLFGGALVQNLYTD